MSEVKVKIVRAKQQKGKQYSWNNLNDIVEYQEKGED